MMYAFIYVGNHSNPVNMPWGYYVGTREQLEPLLERFHPDVLNYTRWYKTKSGCIRALKRRHGNVAIVRQHVDGVWVDTLIDDSLYGAVLFVAAGGAASTKGRT